MKSSLYASPLRVYVLLGLLAAIGVYCGLSLPISLFPNSARPEIEVWSSYGGLTAEEFRSTYGDDLENQLRALTTNAMKVEKVTTSYDQDSVDYDLTFAWGNDGQAAKREVERIVSAWSARTPQEIRDNTDVGLSNRNAGFLAVSFYSDKRNLEDLYDLLKPALDGPLAMVDDADRPNLWNPVEKEVRVELKPQAMAMLGVLPRDVERAVTAALASRGGGHVRSASDRIDVTMPRSALRPEDLAHVPLLSAGGFAVHLDQVAKVDFGPDTKNSSIMKTSGVPSIILFARPKPGGNVKKMAEDILAIVDQAMHSLPSDVHYKVLVDPSSFIRASIRNVSHEVIVGSLLAVSVLFVFIGSLRNVVTAAIEIPLSLVLAFILMRLFGVNLNLISLAGLALSAGMNVDASVVVMENIFRHFEHHKNAGPAERLRILGEAVAEVRLPIIASTIASLVVFLPLLTTSALTYAILGDLAKAVVFSHAFSAIVALVLVPTVRYHLMRRGADPVPPHSLFEPLILRLENTYVRLLKPFAVRLRYSLGLSLALIVALALLITVVLPRLPREVIGTPDSDMMYVAFSTSGNANVRQMETQSDGVERDLLSSFGKDIDYTFTQINNANRASILARLKDKDAMQRVWSAMEAHFKNTPTLKFTIAPWNPSELPIPDPPELKVAIRGGSLKARRDTALAINDLLEGQGLFTRVYADPAVERAYSLRLTPDLNRFALLGSSGDSPADLADLSRVATEGRLIGHLPIGQRDYNIVMRFPDEYVGTAAELGALPLKIGGKLLPFKAMFNMQRVDREPSLYRENGQELFAVYGRMAKSAKRKAANAVAKAEAALKSFNATLDGKSLSEAPRVSLEDAGQDVTDAMRQLGLAIAASVGLILVVLLVQFGSVGEALLVLVAVPLGFLGVLTSLWVFRSNLSLNSALGVILLNGIAVNNSIILVDFTKRLWLAGRAPLDAAVEAARLRLRPILITSLTTILGMLPIALGLGEGGRILKPLGIAVAGGLWLSMLLTLFLVPALQVAYLERRRRPSEGALKEGYAP